MHAGLKAASCPVQAAAWGDGQLILAGLSQHRLLLLLRRDIAGEMAAQDAGQRHQQAAQLGTAAALLCHQLSCLQHPGVCACVGWKAVAWVSYCSFAPRPAVLWPLPSDIAEAISDA